MGCTDRRLHLLRRDRERRDCDSVGLSLTTLLCPRIVVPTGLRRTGVFDRISESRVAIARRARRSGRRPLGPPSRAGDIRLA
jgi:hypothetical protein